MNWLTSLPIPVQTVLLLIASNAFMTMAWYGHLKSLSTAPWYVATSSSAWRSSRSFRKWSR